MRFLSVAAAAVALVLSGATAHGGAAARPVALVGRIPAIGTGQTWRATIRSPRAPLVIVRRAGRSLRFRTLRRTAGLYTAAIHVPTAGRWAVQAVVGNRRYRLGTLRVVTRPYRLSVPSQLVTTPDGSLLVAERGARTQVTRIDLATGLVSTFATLPIDPYGLAWDGGRLLVTTHAGIYAVAARGGRARLVDSADVGPLAVSGSTVYYGNETQIGRIDVATGTTSPLPTAVTNPHTLAVDAQGRLLVADTGNGRVLAVDPASGAATALASGLSEPIPLAAVEGGDVIVGEHEAGTLSRVRPGGAPSVFATGVPKPYSIVELGGNLYVAEIGDAATVSGRLVRVTAAGAVSEVHLRR